MTHSAPIEVDPHAREMALRVFALPECLHLPIAARREVDIRRFVGRTIRIVSPGPPTKALLVEAEWSCPVDPELRIWAAPRADQLRAQTQLWVHVDYGRYRQAFERAFPGVLTRALVVDHVLSRGVARLKGFQYLRVCAISEGANASSGGLSEKWAVAYHSTDAIKKKNLANPARIQHADLADIVKMMDLKTGGAHQDPVNEAQALLRKVSTRPS
jgi:hypothetical protein